MPVVKKEKLTLKDLDNFFAVNAKAILSVKSEVDEVSGKGANTLKKNPKVSAGDKFSAA
ncbi:hypothetical protein L1D61_10325 [Vibrio mediterranei]|nr:hypothetical protein [Vibrio mediterranei]